MNNREIKFRVFSKDLNKMLYSESVSEIFFSGSNGGDFGMYIRRTEEHITPEKFGRCVFLDKEDMKTIQQFTGLKDKNGKDIYEGDIVKIQNYIINLCWAKPKMTDFETWKVEWLECGKWNICRENFRPTSELYEVIGNIFENPELLNQ